MQPTPQEDLRAMREALERVAAGDTIASDDAAVIGHTVRSLKRLERSWDKVLPFLVRENAVIRDLLAELAPALPGATRSEIDAAVGAAPPSVDPRLLELTPARDANAALRELLARAIGDLPSGEAGAAGRRRTRAGLAEIVSLRPW